MNVVASTTKTSNTLETSAKTKSFGIKDHEVCLERPTDHIIDASTSSDRSQPNEYYAIVRNIPPLLHSKELRNFFSTFVENGWFKCFHFRHRPEIMVQSIKDECVQVTSSDIDSKRCCCVVSFDSRKRRDEFVSLYHMNVWLDSHGNEIPLRCFIFPVKICELKKNIPISGGHETLSMNDLNSLVELKPPSVMPNGNVGTPTSYFLEEIRLCKLPARLIAKLGLRPKRTRGKYSSVPMTYIGCEEETESIGSSKTQSEGRGVLRKPIELVSDKSGVVTIARSSSSGRRSVNGKTAFQGGNYDESGDASSECEEWERYEAHYDDVTEQDRIKPRKYEDEQEVTWEKGGPGLVWYTDDNFWREVEQGTDCDWKWADDWDVDYSEYYERGSGSMDARDAVDIRRDKMARDGRLTESVFERRSVPPKKKRCLINSDFNEEANFAVFEKYTKQIGSSIMRRHGWRPGVGLGRGNVGSVNPVSADIEEIDGFRPQNERFGVGYRGDKMQRIVCRREPVHTIYTKYDSMRVGDAVDGGESLLRRGELSYMKYRRSSKGNQ